jgi:hypothetical protein
MISQIAPQLGRQLFSDQATSAPEPEKVKEIKETWLAGEFTWLGKHNSSSRPLRPEVDIFIDWLKRFHCVFVF